MRSILCIVLTLVMVLGVVGCGASGSTTGNAVSSQTQSRTTSSNYCAHHWIAATCSEPKTCSWCGQTEGTVVGHSYYNGKCEYCGTEDPSILDYDIGYLSDRKVQYEEEDNEYIVFFGLKNKAMEFIAAPGKAEITITAGGATLYQKTVAFKKSDFTNWTNPLWDSSRYLCGLRIKRSDIKGGTKNSGTLTLKVIIDDGTWFDPDDLTINNLPIASASFSSLLTEERDLVTQTINSAISSLEGAKEMYEKSQEGDFLKDTYMDSAENMMDLAHTDFGIALVVAERHKNVVLSDGTKLYDRIKKLKDSAYIYKDYYSMKESVFDSMIKDTKELYSLID